ncbi:2-polyprenyl-3-methyl-5-hydroxy-6-metoxy-1,4-benzoquinol methylase [Noviherbaspirillum humi]|uniref:2-polyprenyl-3-methyl-5-hydroxy-6-metoxy-1,4-benzoquinol methylase n=1 Tax=Noviherbaspirillum humi TaxID=1688639 RepID=A0A239FXJ1_9BURK|nr:class I SAM-dependent methyltransferase [Noviherbaspirillum humi]SNS61906.1 2-polyprenyl-3-methyl-5-hydroxy-6-metoxy-1,4-benzoquinol methylase [Noviherbaspirillum humi]
MRDFNLEFSDRFQKYQHDFDAVVRHYLLKAVSPFLGDGIKALELGCYKGDMTEQILDYVGDLTVVEGASVLADAVRERFQGRVKVVNSTFEALTMEPIYDVAFLVHTLEHLDDPIAILKRIQSWLKPGGKLIVAVPNANALSRQIAVKMGLIDFNAAVTPAEASHGHRITYASDMLDHHLRQAGLQAVDEGGILLKPLANFQFDLALREKIIDEKYLDGCFELGRKYPDLCASLYRVCASR